MKILLINPKLPDIHSNRDGYISSGLLYLASAFKKKDIDVDFIDFTICFDKNYKEFLINKIKNFNPDVIGIGCLFSIQFSFVCEISKEIKKYFDIPIIIGGMHPTSYYKNILKKCEYIDFIILGEGEISTVELVEKIRKKEHDFYKIDGIAYRKDNYIFCNSKKNYISNLDKIEFPLYELLDLKKYYKDTSRWNNPRNLPINVSLPIVTSRGCHMKCSFCVNFCIMGKKYRYRSYHNVVDEIEFLYKRYNHRHFSFMDDNFTANKKRTINICKEIIKRKLNIQFETPNGISINTLDDEVIHAMVEAGLIRLSLAIESGSDYIRNNIMKKNLSKEKIFQIIDFTKKYIDLIVRTFFIIGMPEETKKTLKETYKMIEDIDVDLPVISNLMPFYGTKVFEQCVRDNLFIEKIDMDDLCFNNNFYLSSKKFFIKPYKLSVKELYYFREKIDKLVVLNIKKKNKKRQNNYIYLGKDYDKTKSIR